MPLPTEIVNCDITQSSGAEFPAGSSAIEFRLSAVELDAAEGVVVPRTPAVFSLNATGQATATLWPNSRGVNSSFYYVFAVLQSGTKVPLGTVYITAGGGPYNLTSILVTGVPASDPSIFSLPYRVAIPNGSAAQPSLAFASETDTGIFRPAANTLSVTIDGTERTRLDVNGVGTVNGTPSLPAFSFTSDPDTGIYRVAANSLGIATNGTERVRVTNSGAEIAGLLTGTVVTQTADDTTAGRITKVGDFGIGGNAIQLTGPQTLRVRNLPTGVYSYASAVVPGGPPDAGDWIRTLIVQLIPTELVGGGNVRRLWLDFRSSATGGHRVWIGSNQNTEVIEWHEVFHQGSLLGTVSQSGGIPTGAVIQRGSNANGEFVRFADGTQICTHVLPEVAPNTADGSVFVSAVGTWTFPATFAAAPITGGGGALSNRWLGLSVPTTTSANYRLISSVTSATASAPRMTAIGRWF